MKFFDSPWIWGERQRKLLAWKNSSDVNGSVTREKWRKRGLNSSDVNGSVTREKWRKMGLNLNNPYMLELEVLLVEIYVFRNHASSGFILIINLE